MITGLRQDFRLGIAMGVSVTSRMRWNLWLGALAAAAVIGSARGENWPAWRGPNGNGVSGSVNLPVKWEGTNQVRWRTPLPEPGNSTPVIWKDRVFVTQPLAVEKKRALLCFDAKSGKQLWQAGVQVNAMERSHNTNPYGSASPATDGERVICWFGSGGLVAYDFNGRELWRKDLGEHNHQFGYGGSPVIHGDMVLLNFGPGTREFLVALNKRTGEELWRHQSETAAADDIHGTWSTPLVVDWQGAPQVISALRGEVAALHPQTGAVIWRAKELGPQAKSSPVSGDGVVIVSGDMQSSEVAVRLGAKGTIDGSQLLWKKNPPKRRVGTGVIHNGRYFGVQTSGIADCLKLENGEVIWEERLTGSGSNNAVWSSPVMAEGKLYIMNQVGDVFVLRAGDKFELLAMNSLKEASNSSVVPAAGALYLRTHKALWCIDTKSN